jgi:hypothetical protein
MGPVLIGGENTPSLISDLDSNIKLKLIETKRIGSGILLHIKI